MSWRISDLEIIATYRIDLYSKGVEKEANSFDWDHDFYDIDRDEKIIWSDANSTKTAADNLQTKFGDGKDGLIPADNRESIRHLVYQHKQHGCDLMARMPDWELNGDQLMISLEGYSELVARERLANSPRVTFLLWFLSNREVNVCLDAKRKRISYAIKIPTDGEIGTSKWSVPVDLLIWIKRPSNSVYDTGTRYRLTKIFEHSSARVI